MPSHPPIPIYTTTWQRVLQAVVAWCQARLDAWREERRRHAAWQALRRLSDATLRDIGIGRAEVGRLLVPPVVDVPSPSPPRHGSVPERRSIRPACPARDAA